MSDVSGDQRLHATLHHLALSSPDPTKVADFYARLLGSAVKPIGEALRVAAKDRRLVIHKGSARTLLHAAYAVRDVSELEQLQERLRRAGVSSERMEDELLGGPALRCADPDGNTFVFGVTSGEPALEVLAEVPPARLQHIVFASPQAAELARFYREALGFALTDVVLDDSEEMRTAFVRSSHEHHTLAVFQAPERRLDHHCYETSSWDALKGWADRWSAQRIPLAWGPGRHGPGNNLFIFVHDPDGNWVEMSAELETVADDRPVGRWPHEPRTLNLWGTALMRS